MNSPLKQIKELSPCHYTCYLSSCLYFWPVFLTVLLLEILTAIWFDSFFTLLPVIFFRYKTDFICLSKIPFSFLICLSNMFTNYFESQSLHFSTSPASPDVPSLFSVAPHTSIPWMLPHCVLTFNILHFIL